MKAFKWLDEVHPLMEEFTQSPLISMSTMFRKHPYRNIRGNVWPNISAPCPINFMWWLTHKINHHRISSTQLEWTSAVPLQERGQNFPFEGNYKGTHDISLKEKLPVSSLRSSQWFSLEKKLVHLTFSTVLLGTGDIRFCLSHPGLSLCAFPSSHISWKTPSLLQHSFLPQIHMA